MSTHTYSLWEEWKKPSLIAMGIMMVLCLVACIALTVSTAGEGRGIPEALHYVVFETGFGHLFLIIFVLGVCFLTIDWLAALLGIILWPFRLVARVASKPRKKKKKKAGKPAKAVSGPIELAKLVMATFEAAKARGLSDGEADMASKLQLKDALRGHGVKGRSITKLRGKRLGEALKALQGQPIVAAPIVVLDRRTYFVCHVDPLPPAGSKEFPGDFTAKQISVAPEKLVKR